ncbi:hypothetical protein DSO57_1011002 [Entomophthora muscae]|uniref:Uncharacterized protein n=1 Tax=Entomophthora muscae TaxID=34485 RepID=A0ACC2RL64_9FUNG|nr:hypothetical protein DSO57_1011002 [Entomophthora muscae]
MDQHPWMPRLAKIQAAPARAGSPEPPHPSATFGAAEPTVSRGIRKGPRPPGSSALMQLPLYFLGTLCRSSEHCQTIPQEANTPLAGLIGEVQAKLVSSPRTQAPPGRRISWGG